MTIQELQERQKWTLKQKIDHSLGVIDQFLSRTEGKAYVSFSGGKDSTVLLHLCRILKPDIKAVFCNTGVEFPDILKFVRQTENVEIIRPKHSFREIAEKDGFPLISKSQAELIYVARKYPTCKRGTAILAGVPDGNFRAKVSNRWQFMLTTEYSCAKTCCKHLKIKPFESYEKATGLNPIIGILADESNDRATEYVKNGGCNIFDKSRIKSHPLSIWTEEDIWAYIKMQNLPIAEIYYKGAHRTGCVGCGFGAYNKDDDRFDLLYNLYPKFYKLFMSYTNNGITYREALRDMLSVTGKYLPDERPIRLFEAFAGYGSQAMALERLGLRYKTVGISEIDKYAIQAYNAIHGETPNYGDISKIKWDKIPDFDLFTYSFPCTDISNAGLQKGLSEGGGTRSGLLWECKKAIEAKKPKYLIMENVKALTEKKFMPEFRLWQNYLTSIGYTNNIQILNAKDYGVPQSRDRVFMVSILGNEWFNFPSAKPLTRCLEDVLEDSVDSKYFLSQKMIDCFLRRNEIAKEKGNGFKFEPNDTSKPAKCVTTAAGTRSDDNYVIQQVGNIYDDGTFSNPERGRVFDAKGISPTLTTMQGGGREPKILQRSRGNNKGGQFDICPTITSNAWQENNFIQTAAIRKLTPRECFRLMDVSDSDIDKIQSAGISNTQQYKMAGNSIVVACLEGVFRQLFCEDKEQGMTLFG